MTLLVHLYMDIFKILSSTLTVNRIHRQNNISIIPILQKGKLSFKEVKVFFRDLWN